MLRSRITSVEISMDTLALLIGFIALLLAINARKAAKALVLQLAGQAASVRFLEEEVQRLRGLRPEAPTPPTPEAAQPSPPPPVEPEPQREAAPAQPAATGGPEPSPIPAVAASPAPTGPTLEERLGTRWAVWVGGLALALGGLLLVRHSIEQGLFGPGVRISAGALFSLVLVAA